MTVCRLLGALLPAAGAAAPAVAGLTGLLLLLAAGVLLLAAGLETVAGAPAPPEALALFVLLVAAGAGEPAVELCVLVTPPLASAGDS